MSEQISATFVVIGGGISGVSCVERLKFLCPDAKIVLISATPVVKTIANLSQLTKLLSTFDVVEKTADEYAQENETVKILISKVDKINATRNEIQLSDGRTVSYQYLCLCHGARPKIIDENNPFVLGIRDTESVCQFQQRLSGAHRIGIVGNGGIANELAHFLKGVDIVWIIKDDSVNATFVDAGAGQFFFDEMSKETDSSQDSPQILKRARYGTSTLPNTTPISETIGGALGPDWHKGIDIKGLSDHKQIKVEFEVQVKRILSKEDFLNDESAKYSFAKSCEEISEFSSSIRDDWNVYLELTNGRVYGFDFIVSATGVMPNGRQIQVECDDGTQLALGDDEAILVNEQMETNIPGIFAAGDVCQVVWESQSRHWFQMRLWTQARQMGLYVAHCLDTHHKSCGVEKHTLDFCFEMFTHVTKFFGHKVVLLGLFNGQGLGSDYNALLRTTKGHEYVKTVMQDGRMQGAVLIGETDLEETFENLILNQLNLSDLGVDLLDPNIDIEDFFD